MELEVGEIFLQLEEILKVEHFVECPCSIEIAHLAVGGVECLCHPHYLCAEGSHTGTAAHPDHLGLGIDNRMEISVRPAHQHLVTRLE